MIGEGVGAIRSDFSGRRQTSCTEPMLDRLVELLRPGGLLVTDNVLWNGEVVPGFVDKPPARPGRARAIAEYNERLKSAPAELLDYRRSPLRDGVAISVKKGMTPAMTIDAWLESRNRGRRAPRPARVETAARRSGAERRARCAQADFLGSPCRAAASEPTSPEAPGRDNRPR